MGFLWVIFCIVVGYYANERGRNPIGWGLLAVVISPLLAGIALAVSKDLSIEEEIDNIDKKTENIQREVEHNQEFNKLHRENSGKKEIAASDEDGYISSNDKEKLTEKIECSNCGEYVGSDNNFCPICGSKIIPEGMRECPDCQEIIDKGIRYCNECGYKLKPECPSCNQEVKFGLNFCPYCGSELNFDNEKADGS